MAQVKRVVARYFGPGGKYEVGDDEWMCGHKVVRGKCFIRGPRTLRDFYDRAFRENEECECFVYQTERYTYGRVQELVAALALHLIEVCGVQKGDRVCICMRNYAEWPISYIAATAIGAVAVPLNSLWKAKELDYAIRDSRPLAMLCDGEKYKVCKATLDDLVIPTVLVKVEHGNMPRESTVQLFSDVVVANLGRPMPANWAKHDDIAAIMYTSGTTGFPKGVVQTHRNICNQMTRVVALDDALAELGIRPKRGTQSKICPVPLFHVTASHHVFLDSFVRGIRMILMFKWDAGVALQLIDREKPTSWTGVPTMIQDLMEHPNFAQYDTSSLKQIGGGGGPTPTSQVKKTASKFKGGSASQGYGLTETNGGVVGIGGDEYLRKPTSVGKPGELVQYACVDPNSKQPRGVLPPNVPGELVLKGPFVMSHYWNKTDKTAEAIISIPDRGNGWFRTGDIVRVDEDGYIHIMDRAKDLIIRGGENISCAEVEAAFFSTDRLLEVAAFAIKDERLGERVGVLMVPLPGKTVPSKRELLVLVAGKLAHFKVPAAEDMFFQKEQLPRGATGKILKRAIRARINDEIARGTGRTSKL
jgi:long-chain acyl-CoA synthetase